jgi:mono/diheme cytochrome c family protein
MRKSVICAIVIMLVAVIGGAIFIYSGLYSMGADAPHWQVTENLLDTLRERSITHYAQSVQVPDLNDARLAIKGAGEYDAMCVSCHLAPGKADSDIRPGLYPAPPNLSQHRMEPKVTFWVIKHGVKMSGMPAWGANHDDATLWSIVAFLNKLPDLSAQQYADMVAKAGPEDEHSSMPHNHGGTPDTEKAGKHQHD